MLDDTAIILLDNKIQEEENEPEVSVLPLGTFATNEYERMILPGTYTLTVTFKINDDKGGQEQTATATIENQIFEAGHVYNFTADIKSGLKYIEFTINPSDWTAGSDNNIQG